MIFSNSAGSLRLILFACGATLSDLRARAELGAGDINKARIGIRRCSRNHCRSHLVREAALEWPWRLYPAPRWTAGTTRHMALSLASWDPRQYRQKHK